MKEKKIWDQFRHYNLGIVSAVVLIVFCIVGIYAPFLASSRPIMVIYDGAWYFPMIRYLFYQGFYTKWLDLFFNLLIFTIPLILFAVFLFKGKKRSLIITGILIVNFLLFILFITHPIKDPASDPKLNLAEQEMIQSGQAPYPSWDFTLRYMTPYAQLNAVLRYQQRKEQHQRLLQYQESYSEKKIESLIKDAVREKKNQLARQGISQNEMPSEEVITKEVLKDLKVKELSIPTLWQMDEQQKKQQIQREKEVLKSSSEGSENYQYALAKLQFIYDKEQWLKEQSKKITFIVMPLIRSFHWEEDAGGEQNLNQYISWWELSRINRKDLVAALIFGIRVSLVVGILAVSLALAIGVPVGAVAGYYGGRFDIIISRLLEIWESMPTFFMLLMVVSILQSKSIFLVITIIGLFGWTGFARYIRGEFFKQRNLPYVEACSSLGFPDRKIIFKHILPNAVPPLLTLLPFSIMGAITSEAGLSFLGLGEEGSASWGVLMNEGRIAFPGESYLLWPPAILLTILLIAIALVGDALRDAIDPKMHK